MLIFPIISLFLIIADNLCFKNRVVTGELHESFARSF